jgi:hypothetical protein
MSQYISCHVSFMAHDLLCLTCHCALIFVSPRAWSLDSWHPFDSLQYQMDVQCNLNSWKIIQTSFRLIHCLRLIDCPPKPYSNYNKFKMDGQKWKLPIQKRLLVQTLLSISLLSDLWLFHRSTHICEILSVVGCLAPRILTFLNLLCCEQ